jgi:hypothetical protein
LGQTLLEYWLSHLAAQRAERVLILTSRPFNDFEALVGSGTRWGLSVKIVLQIPELNPEEALSKYGGQLDGAPAKVFAEVLDHFPGVPQPRVFESHAEFFRALQVWMPRAITPDRVGMRQVCPGVWTGANARISPEAQLHAPCWIGQRVVIGPGAILGPNSIVEDGAFIDTAAVVTTSWIASHTFVGRLARVTNSLAWGNWLVNWQNGSATRVPDPFVLSALRRPSGPGRPWLQRLKDLYFRRGLEETLPWNGLVAAKQEPTHESCPEH